MATPPRVIVETILATGMTHHEAAAFFNVTDRWIRTLIHRYNTGGIDPYVTVFIPATGTQIGEYTLDENKLYHPNQLASESTKKDK